MSPLLLLTVATLFLTPSEGWTKQKGCFATFQTPPGMVKKTDVFGMDSILDIYESPEIGLAFDSQIHTVPVTIQADLDKAIGVWATERRKNWKVNTYVYDEKEMPLASIYSSDHDKLHPVRPYSLFLGFSVGEHSFAISVEFRSLDDLDQVERLLKSIKINDK